jgi:hypothetical protein
MRNKDVSKADIKCFFCTEPIGEDHVGWMDQNAIYRLNRYGTPTKTKDNIFLCPGCAIQLGRRLMIDGFKSHKPTYRTALKFLEHHLRCHKDDADE